MLSGCPGPSEIPCVSSRDCSGAGLVCDLDNEVCVECITAVDCLGENQICRSRSCVTVTPCESSRTCPGQVCDTTLGYCVDCVTDNDCGATQQCSGGFCEERPPTCDSDRDCSALDRVCDLAAMECVECVRDADCDARELCEGRSCVAQECTPLTGQCVSDTSVRSCDNRGHWNRIEDCQVGLLCVSGTCTDGTCASPCSGGESCQAGTCQCGGGAPCGAGQQCVGGACTAVSCFACAPGETCNASGACGCGAGPSCPAGQSCVDGACTVPECVPACGSGETCTSGTCRCGAGPACGLGEECIGGTCECVTTAGTQVDMLFMVDNSNSMMEEQTALAAQLPQIVRVLATGDLDQDGTPEFPAVQDLHLGVVNSDMGTGGYTVPTCPRPDFGDDGILRTQGQPGLVGCIPPYPSFLTFSPGAGDSPEVVAADFGCIARAGTGGCGFEQQLEAVLKAVTPSGSALRFHSGTRGHGDIANAGFLRPDSVLATVLVTDENDCSAANPRLFDPLATELGDLNLRCPSYPEYLHPTSRYVNGILGLRGDPRDVIFAAVTGVPADLVASGYPPAYDTILADSRMVETPLPGSTTLDTSCSSAFGNAYPPRRIVEVARDINARGATGVLGSICQGDFSGPVRDILDRLLRRLGESCVAR